MLFRDRETAGRRLVPLLEHHRGEDAIVLALPRGGLPVAFPIAEALGAPLDVFLVRKLGAPREPELAMGALAEDGTVVVEDRVIAGLDVSPAQIRAEVERATVEIDRRRAAFRGGRALPDLRGKVVIIVDDGLATGSTARAAVRAIRHQGPKRIVLAVPVAAEDSLRALAPELDEIVCPESSADFRAVGFWYRDFEQLTDDDVLAWLARAARPAAPRGAVTIPTCGVVLEGDLELPDGATGVVLFAHGSGSSRFSPRNRLVAAALRGAGLGTLLLDLLTTAEEAEDEATGARSGGVALLASRLTGVLDWLGEQDATRARPIGLFGASTGAAAALIAASRRPSAVHAVVSRGGRPDLAASVLERVRAPTLLIVGACDAPVVEMNRTAFAKLRCEKQLVLVPGATHLFEEPGALDEVARLASGWLGHYLVAYPADERGAA